MDRRAFFKGLLGLAALPFVPLKVVAKAVPSTLSWDFTAGSIVYSQCSWFDITSSKPTLTEGLTQLVDVVDGAAEEVSRWEHLMGIGCNVAQAATKAADVVEKHLS